MTTCRAFECDYEICIACPLSLGMGLLTIIAFARPFNYCALGQTDRQRPIRAAQMAAISVN